jgi:hypothetical protein
MGFATPSVTFLHQRTAKNPIFPKSLSRSIEGSDFFGSTATTPLAKNPIFPKKSHFFLQHE